MRSMRSEANGNGWLPIEILARLVLHASGLAKGFHLGIAELAPLPFRQAIQGKRSEVRAVQLHHLVADCRTHAFHLAFPAFVNGDFHIGFTFGYAFDANLGGQRGTVVELDSALKDLRLLLRHNARDARMVRFIDMVARV